MANELESSNQTEIEAGAEEQVELDEFKASGENSAVADPVVKGSNKRPADKAAGFTELAEIKKVFIIAPNGQATRKGGLWSYDKIFPGSTIVVPRRIKLTSNIDAISAITSVVYKLTVTLAGIDSLFND